MRRLGKIIDSINVVLTAIIVVSAVMLLISVEKYMYMFPVVFTAAALMNIALAVKFYKMRHTLRELGLIGIALVMIFLTVISVIVAM